MFFEGDVDECCERAVDVVQLSGVGSDLGESDLTCRELIAGSIELLTSGSGTPVDGQRSKGNDDYRQEHGQEPDHGLAATCG